MAEENPSQPVRVSRDELYRQVWEIPMSRLAAQYGISGNGLAKICRRLQIPIPGRGFWARKASGQEVVQVRLADANADTPREVTITPTPAPVKTPDLPPELEKQLATTREEMAAVLVPDRLTRPHSVIAGWLTEHDRRKREASLERDPWLRRHSKVPEFTNIERRRHRILDTLFKKLEQHGFEVKAGEYQGVFLEIHGERIDFELREKLRQIRRELTDEEKQWDTHSKWRQERQPTGQLVFTIKTHLSAGLKQAWLDKSDNSIEIQLPEIVATLLLAGPILQERRRQWQEAERRRLEEEHKRYEEEQRRLLDRNRWRRLVELAHQWQDAETVRRFLASLTVRPSAHDAQIGQNSLAEWLEWADERVTRSDPLLSGREGVFQELSKVEPWTYRDVNTNVYFDDDGQ